MQMQTQVQPCAITSLPHTPTLWFTTYQQEKPLFQHVELMNAVQTH